MRDHFGGLAHVEVGDGIGETALQPDHRVEIGRPHFQERGELAEGGARGGEFREPAHARLRKHERGVAQRLGAAGEDHVGVARLDITIRGVDRLHAGAAIDLHREGHHLLAHAEPQRGDARRVHLVGDDVDAAENDLIERARRERLPRQQRASRLHREIDRREGSGAALRLEKRRSAAVDDINRARHQLAALSGVVCFG